MQFSQGGYDVVVFVQPVGIASIPCSRSQGPTAEMLTSFLATRSAGAFYSSYLPRERRELPFHPRYLPTQFGFWQWIYRLPKNELWRGGRRLSGGWGFGGNLNGSQANIAASWRG
ncbi:MAG: hypothetical protein ACI9HK_003561 [Pirellulaceae bacterium]|jgi:hypothetical protein